MRAGKLDGSGVGDSFPNEGLYTILDNARLFWMDGWMRHDCFDTQLNFPT